MILITGGAYQGKLEFAKKLYNERKCGVLESPQEMEKLEKNGNQKDYPGVKELEKDKHPGHYVQTEQTKQQQEEKEPVIAEGKTAHLKQLQRADIISHFHLWIRRLLKDEENPYLMVEKLLEENPDVLIELTQLGCGVVSIDKFDREYRETVGRLGCLLAKEAEAVYLVHCGIARKIK